MLKLTIRDFDGEPRMRDLDIAGALEFERPRKIRELIERFVNDIEDFGDLIRVVGGVSPHGGAKPTEASRGGRPTHCYWLNEEQALFLCTRSEAKGAVALTKQMVMIFAAWRRGQLPPAPDMDAGISDLHPDAALWCRMIREARMLFGRDRARWLWQKSPLPQLPDFVDPEGCEATEPQAIVLQFLRSGIEVTGDRRDFVTSREVLTAFASWAGPLGYVLGDRAASVALKAVSAGYRDPATGKGFSPHKRSVSGYIGLRLRSQMIAQQ